MSEQLLTHQVVVDAKKRLTDEGLSLGTRRHLLARALRLTPTVAPALHRMLDESRERLDVTHDVELYVYASPSFNAACTPPEDDRVFIMFSSSLLEAFEPDELLFVLGHELGHHRYDHHAIPVGMLLSEHMAIKPALAMQLYSWQRLAEISADRAGILCCGEFEAAARAFFKLSSGLTKVPGPDEIRAFVDQADALFEESAKMSSTDQKNQMDWASSHPFSPIRLQAVEHFVQSEAMGQGDRTLAEVDAEIRDLLQLMEGSYLTEDSPEAEIMRRAMFAAAVTLAAQDGEVTADERAAIEELLGARRVPPKLATDAIAQVLDERLDQLKENISAGRRVQWMRDLTRIALADEVVHDEERRLLVEIAHRIEVPVRVIDATLHAPTELD
jgi:tellurite resistance protein